MGLVLKKNMRSIVEQRKSVAEQEVGINYNETGCAKNFMGSVVNSYCVGHVAPAPPFKWVWFVMLGLVIMAGWLASSG